MRPCKFQEVHKALDKCWQRFESSVPFATFFCKHIQYTKEKALIQILTAGRHAVFLDNILLSVGQCHRLKISISLSFTDRFLSVQTQRLRCQW